MKTNSIKVIMVIVLVIVLSIVVVAHMKDGTKIQYRYGWYGKDTGHMANCSMYNSLTEEQKGVMSQKITEIKEQGTSLEEMKVAMKNMFEELGIEHVKGGCGRYKSFYGDYEDIRGEKTSGHMANCPMHQ